MMMDLLNNYVNRFKKLSKYIPDKSDLTIRIVDEDGCYDIDAEMVNGKLMCGGKEFSHWKDVVRIKHLGVPIAQYDKALEMMWEEVA